jgi:S-disulfanyl-L-cysteine oxidoreductase SoxD
MKKIIGFVAVTALMVSGLYVSLGAQTGKSVKEGVYTAEQAKRGEALYKEQCAACHGEDLAGSGPMPALSGNDFIANWKTVGDLFEKTHTSMPASAPGSLSEQQTSDILAYMLSKSNFPAGQTELAAKQDELAQIRIEKP